MKTYMEFLETETVINAMIDFYRHNISYDTLAEILIKEAKDEDFEFGIVTYLTEYPNMDGTDVPTSSGSILSGIYDVDFDAAEEDWHGRNEKVLSRIRRAIKR